MRGYLSAIFSNIKAEKLKFIFTTFIMMVGLLMLVLSSSIEKGISEFIDIGLLETPSMRKVEVLDEKLYDILKKDERVLDAYTSNGVVNLLLSNGPELFGADNDEIKTNIYSSCYEKYIVEGRGVLESNEIVIPKYLISYGELYGSQYIDLEGLVGREIEFKYNKTSIYTGYVYSTEIVSFKIVGVYDNMTISQTDFLIDENIYNEIVKESTVRENDESIIIQALKDIGLDESYLNRADEIFESDSTYRYLICNRYEDISLLEKEYNCELSKYAEIDGSLRTEIDFFAICFKFLSVIMLAFSLTNIIFTIIQNIARRSGELALLYATGYEKHQIAFILFGEYCIGAICAATVALGLSSIILVYAKKLIVFLEIGFMPVKLKLGVESFVISILIVLMVSLVSFFVAYWKITKLDIVKVLKQEEDISKVYAYKRKKKFSLKKIGIVLGIIFIIILGCGFLVNSWSLSIEKNNKKAKEDIRYISISYNEYDEELMKNEKVKYIISRPEEIQSFLEDMPKLKGRPSVLYSVIMGSNNMKVESKVSMLMVYNVRNDKGGLDKNVLGMNYDFSFVNGEKLICNYDTNHSKYEIAPITNKFVIDDEAIVTYISDYAKNNKEKLELNKLQNIINECKSSKNSLGVEEFGKYIYKDITGDTSEDFGIKFKEDIEAVNKMIFEIDEKYSLYVFFTESIQDNDYGEYFYGYDTEGIILFNSDTGEWINLLINSDKLNEFIAS